MKSIMDNLMIRECQNTFSNEMHWYLECEYVNLLVSGEILERTCSTISTKLPGQPACSARIVVLRATTENKMAMLVQ